jgi:hypothetical protein
VAQVADLVFLQMAAVVVRVEFSTQRHKLSHLIKL